MYTSNDIKFVTKAAPLFPAAAAVVALDNAAFIGGSLQLSYE